jgi:hypothetical protein
MRASRRPGASELVILFDPDGIVTAAGYERTEIPSKRGY